jgi:hypothetical protein
LEAGYQEGDQTEETVQHIRGVSEPPDIQERSQLAGSIRLANRPRQCRFAGSSHPDDFNDLAG